MNVNTHIYQMIDDQRKETHIDNKNHPHREFVMQAWYPQTDDATTRYPLLIYSPGLMGSHTDNVTLCHNLASNGYVVIGISHPYVLGTVEFPDGRKALPSLSFAGLNYQQGQDLLTNEMEIWLADSQYILNHLTTLPFFQKIDSNAIGVFGFSFGGATAVQLCRRDARIKACINLDGPLNGKDQTEPFNKPCMFLLGEKSETRILDVTPMPEDMLNAFGWSREDEAKNMQRTLLPAIDKLISNIGKDVYKVMIEQATHATFTESALLQHDQHAYIYASISAFITNFFDAYLKEKASAIKFLQENNPSQT